MGRVVKCWIFFYLTFFHVSEISTACQQDHGIVWVAITITLAVHLVDCQTQLINSWISISISTYKYKRHRRVICYCSPKVKDIFDSVYSGYQNIYKLDLATNVFTLATTSLKISFKMEVAQPHFAAQRLTRSVQKSLELIFTKLEINGISLSGLVLFFLLRLSFSLGPLFH